MLYQLSYARTGPQRSRGRLNIGSASGVVNTMPEAGQGNRNSILSRARPAAERRDWNGRPRVILWRRRGV